MLQYFVWNYITAVNLGSIDVFTHEQGMSLHLFSSSIMSFNRILYFFHEDSAYLLLNLFLVLHIFGEYYNVNPTPNKSALWITWWLRR